MPGGETGFAAQSLAQPRSASASAAPPAAARMKKASRQDPGASDRCRAAPTTSSFYTADDAASSLSFRGAGDVEARRGGGVVDVADCGGFELGVSRTCRQCGGGQCGRVVFNVSGHAFETQRRTLARFPGTLLGSPRHLRPYWDESRKQYCLDGRHPATFQCVLYYYQSGGRLYRDEHVPEDVFMSELDFYALDASVVSAFKLRNGFLPSQEAPSVPGGALRQKLWLALEYPSTSWPAVAFASLSLLVTCLSLLCFALESLPQFDEIACVSEYALAAATDDDDDGSRTNGGGGSGGDCVAPLRNDSGYGNSTVNVSAAVRIDVRESQNFSGPFFVIECCCVAWFTSEALLRFVTCDSKRRYFRSATNLFDVFAVLPFFIVLAIVMATDTCDHSKSDSAVLILLRVLRLLRSARVFKLTKHSRGMHILGLTIVHSVKELTLFLLFTAIAVSFFASAAYYADAIDTGSASLRSIPDALWYVIITYCTVGYGDVVPKGPIAKTVGAACCVCGVITIGLLVPVVVTNFSRFYNHELVDRAATPKREPAAMAGCMSSARRP